MIVSKEYEDSDSADQEIYKKENESLVKEGLQISIQERQAREIVITSPKYGHEIYIAVGTVVSNKA